MEEYKKEMLMVSAILFKNNVPVEEAKLIGTFIEKLIEENQQLKDLIVEKNNQLKDMQSQHTDYTQVNILKMKLEASEKARKEAIELLSIAYGISVDYDGFNDVAGLKAVIDDMARAIKKAKIVLDIDKVE